MAAQFEVNPDEGLSTDEAARRRDEVGPNQLREHEQRSVWAILADQFKILFLNLVTDLFPALALGIGEGDEGTMRRPPRDPSEPVLSRRHWMGIGGYGIVFAGAVLGALFWATRGLGLEGEAAVTVSFLTLAFGQLWHVFNMRQPESGVLSNEVTRNRYVWAAVGFCVLLLFGAVYVPGVGQVLEVQPPSAEAWGIIALMSLVPLGVGQIVLLVRGYLKSSREKRTALE